jgi:tyrosyl-tRNA synthetase
MEMKKRLAREITAQFHESSAADAAQENFERVVQRRDLPEDIPEFAEPSLAPAFDGETRRLSNIIVDAGLAPSAAEAKRLISQGAVQVIFDGEGDTRTFERDDRAAGLGLEPRSVLKVGRRRFVRLVSS